MSKTFSENIGGGAVKPPVISNPQQAMVAAQSSPELADQIMKYYEMESRKQQLELQKLEREEQALQAERDKWNELQRIKMEESENMRKKRIADQSACDHKQKGGLGKTLIRAQNPGTRRLIAHCIRCAKIWHEQSEGGFQDELGGWLPPHLQPQPEHIGGFVN